MVSGSITFSNEKQSIQNGTKLYVPTSPTFQNDTSLSIWPNQTQWLPKFGDNRVQGMTWSGPRRGQATYHGYGGPQTNRDLRLCRSAECRLSGSVGGWNGGRSPKKEIRPSTTVEPKTNTKGTEYLTSFSADCIQKQE